MEKIIKNSAFILLVVGGVFAACKKESVDNAPYSVYGVDTSKTQLKIIYSSAYAGNDTVYLKLNGSVISGKLVQRSPFPGGGYNTGGSNYPLYLNIPKGNHTVSVVKLRKGFTDDSIQVYSTPISLPDNGPYTLLIGDTLTSTLNKTGSVLIKNDISTVDTSKCRYRFVNLMPNVAAIDLYLNGVKVDSNIAYLQAGKAFELRNGPFAPGVTNPASPPTPTWTIRPAGAAPTSTALASYASANTMLSRKVYTVFAVGYQGATGTRLPFVSFTLDKNN